MEKYDDGTGSFPDISYRKGAAYTLDFGLYCKSIGDFYDHELAFKDKRRLYFHCGVDRAAGPVFCPFDGRIIFDQSAGNYGTMLTIYPDGADFLFRVAHMAAITEQAQETESAGKKIKAGTLLGMAGNQGIGTGPHTHAELVSTGERSVILDHILTLRGYTNPEEYKDLLYPHIMPEDRAEWDAYTQARGFGRFNDSFCERRDGYRGGRELVTYYNSRHVFGM